MSDSLTIMDENKRLIGTVVSDETAEKSDSFTSGMCHRCSSKPSGQNHYRLCDNCLKRYYEHRSEARRDNNNYEYSVNQFIREHPYIAGNSRVDMPPENWVDNNKLVFASDRMSEVMKKAYLAAKYANSNVLICGETGVGKEVIAREIHEKSPRGKNDFGVIDCSALTRTLAESELFGHTRGAYTDAKEGTAGIFQKANRGTVFIDEIESLPLEIQGVLLRVMETKEIRKVGSSDYQKLDVRFIIATNKNLKQLVEGGKFRRDLYYRISTVKINIPSLRERGPTELEALIDHFTTMFRAKSISPEAYRKAMAYSWPGNVRELKRAIEGAVILGDGVIFDFDLDEPDKNNPIEKDYSHTHETMALEALRSLREVNSSGAGSMPLEKAKEKFESLYIQEILYSVGGNIAQAARALRTSREGLYDKIKKYGLVRK